MIFLSNVLQFNQMIELSIFLRSKNCVEPQKSWLYLNNSVHGSPSHLITVNKTCQSPSRIQIDTSWDLVCTVWYLVRSEFATTQCVRLWISSEPFYLHSLAMISHISRLSITWTHEGYGIMGFVLCEDMCYAYKSLALLFLLLISTRLTVVGLQIADCVYGSTSTFHI